MGRDGRNRSGVLSSLPTPVKDRLRPAARRLRTAIRNPSDAPATLPYPMGDHIGPRERASVDAALSVLAEAGVPHFYVPDQEPLPIRFGVPAEAGQTLLRAVERAGDAVVVSWANGRRFRTVAGSAAASAFRGEPDVLWIHHELRAATEQDVSDVARAVQVEFWAADGQGGHRCPSINSYASSVRIGEPMGTRRSRTGHDLPTFRDFQTPDFGEVHFPVDAVYLWVDDADPAWRQRRDAAVRDLGGEPVHESSAEARFRQHDELRYSLRSLSQFAPWIRHVYLVTDQQVPEWLNEQCPRISVVDHRDLFLDKGNLPTYNSHALSARLHHIPGLADHFVYMNDDFFFGRRTGAELWFDGNGQPRCHYTRTTAEPSYLSDESPLTAARNHTFVLAERLTGRVRRRNLQHGPYAFSKELLFDLERMIHEEFDRTWRSQFRHETDFVMERLHHQVGHAWGRVIDGRGVRYRYFNVGVGETEALLQDELRSRWADTFCINDAEGPVSPYKRGRLIRDFLGEHFPSPSEFER